MLIYWFSIQGNYSRDSLRLLYFLHNTSNRMLITNIQNIKSFTNQNENRANSCGPTHTYYTIFLGPILVLLRCRWAGAWDSGRVEWEGWWVNTSPL